MVQEENISRSNFSRSRRAHLDEFHKTCLKPRPDSGLELYTWPELTRDRHQGHDVTLPVLGGRKVFDGSGGGPEPLGFLSSDKGTP